ncbi:MAG: lysophospholipid acyltransferase family protein [Dehalococcoidia bacterium]
MGLFYLGATATMKVLLIAFTRWHVEGKENVPRRGPLIIVSNHLSVVDPPLLSASIPRRIEFMAKQELFEPRLMGFVVRSYGAFPIRRGQLDRAAMRRALDGLRSGLVLGMFPEGKRSPNARLQSAQLGASLLAGRSGVPVLPVGITGSEQVRGRGFILRRPRITVNIGRPFSLPTVSEGSTRDRLTQHSDLMMERIAELLPQRYREPDAVQGGSGSVNGD